MITDIITYIGSYDEVRAITGLNNQELPDSALALLVYRHQLGLALNSISGTYSPSTEDETLQVIYDRPLDSADPLYVAIQLYSMYTVADKVMDSVGLTAYKTLADGKGNITRFSPESAYQDTRKAIKGSLNTVRADILELLGETPTTADYLLVATPDVDLVTGE